MRRTGKEGLHTRVVKARRKGDIGPPFERELASCDECDPEFPCYAGNVPCAREPEEVKWDST